MNHAGEQERGGGDKTYTFTLEQLRSIFRISEGVTFQHPLPAPTGHFHRAVDVRVYMRGDVAHVEFREIIDGRLTRETAMPLEAMFGLFARLDAFLRQNEAKA